MRRVLKGVRENWIPKTSDAVSKANIVSVVLYGKTGATNIGDACKGAPSPPVLMLSAPVGA
jgi:hypothetical protein